MANGIWLDLAERGARFPIGTDLVLHQDKDPEGAKFDAGRLGRAVERAARTFRSPVAIPLMDLTLEKADLLNFFGVPENERDAFHFEEPPSQNDLDHFFAFRDPVFRPRHAASIGAVRYIADRTDLLPAGMLIGPFSLTTKLMKDPISAVALSGRGVTGDEEAGVRVLERCLEMALSTVLRSARAQIEAGARAIIVCEPAANTVYLSPRQMRAGSNLFERFVLGPMRQVKALLDQNDVDLFLHDCGELTGDMVRQFAAELRPAVLSLGSSRKLWEDAALVPATTVLYGNLPTKRFYSDADLPVDEVRRFTADLVAHMRASGHPHIVGSECDVLYVPEAAETIRAKVDAMLTADAGR